MDNNTAHLCNLDAATTAVPFCGINISLNA